MYFSIKDGKYWYNVHGEGMPIVMLHGFTGSLTTWEPIFPYLNDNFQVITVDLPGHGKTRCNTPRGMDAFCKDLFQLTDQIGVDTFHLLGYSMGGRTALSFALSYPERVRSLILESASPGLESQEERNQRIKNDEALAKKIMQNGVASFVKEWENIPLFKSQKKLPKEIQERIHKERLQQNAYGLSMSLKHMGTGIQPSNWDNLHRFRKPTLLLCGEYDEKFIQINKRMQNLLPFSKLEICEGLGHAIHVENPHVFGKIITEFILESEDKE